MIQRENIQITGLTSKGGKFPFGKLQDVLLYDKSEKLTFFILHGRAEEEAAGVASFNGNEHN